MRPIVQFRAQIARFRMGIVEYRTGIVPIRGYIVPNRATGEIGADAMGGNGCQTVAALG